MDRLRPKVIIWNVLRVQEARKMNSVAAQSHSLKPELPKHFFLFRNASSSIVAPHFHFLSQSGIYLTFFFCVLLLVPSFFPFFFLCLTLLRDDDCCNVYVLSLLATLGQCMQHLNPLSRITFLLEICSTWLTEIS